MDTYLTVLVTVVGVVAVELLVLLALGGGSLARLGLASAAFRKVLGDASVAEKIRPLLTTVAAPAGPTKKSGEPLRLLALLQRDAKLVDFLMQDLAGAGDSDIAVFVREMHPKAQQVLKSHLDLGPVLPQAEGETVTVPPGFDPSAVRLYGNLTGQPPYRGTLKHGGWCVKDYTIPAPPEGQDELVLAPAEVDL